MGTIVKPDRVEHKRQESIQRVLLPVSTGLYPDIFKGIKMAEIKVMILISNILGITLTGIAPWVNFSTWQGMIIFVLVVAFWIQKLYKGYQDIRNRELSLKHKKHNIEKKIEDDEEERNNEE